MEDLDVKTYRHSELDSLIRLLADDHEKMQSMVSARLLELGDRIVPSLWDARSAAEETVRSRIDDILARLSTEAGEELALSEWRGLVEVPGDVNLEHGVSILAKLHTPDLRWAPYETMLDQMADELAIRLSGIHEPNDIVEIFTRYIFKEQGYKGGEDADYFDADEHYLDRVIKKKIGVPIALSLICLLLADRLSLPVFGVGLPDHFIVKYQDNETEILFAPFHDGAVITREECEEFVIRRRLRFFDEILAPVPNRYILERVLGNLRRVYLHCHERDKIKVVTQYLKLVKGEHT